MDELLRLQDGVITRKQALGWLTPDALHHRLGRRWQVLLPGVYLAAQGPPTARQKMRAALLFVGPGGLLSDTTALRVMGVPYLPVDQMVRVLIPDAVQRLSREFVVVRRSTRMPERLSVSGMDSAPPVRALCEFGLRHPNERESLAVFAAAVQRRLATVDELMAEAAAGPARGRPRLLRVIAPLAAGIRSAPEADFRSIVDQSRVLPTPLWNPTIELADGRRFSPDALFVDAGLVHETNGRRFHAPDERGDGLFDEMQRRHDALVSAGLVVLHNSPRRIAEEPAQVRAEVETCYRRHRGSGLPKNVRLIREGPAVA
jgi:hypothetical protein